MPNYNANVNKDKKRTAPTDAVLFFTLACLFFIEMIYGKRLIEIINYTKIFKAAHSLLLDVIFFIIIKYCQKIVNIRRFKMKKRL